MGRRDLITHRLTYHVPFHQLLQKCTPIHQDNPMSVCPGCQKPCRAIYMCPMSFLELDEARKTAAEASASGKREKKRKTATIARLNPEVSSSVNSIEEPGGNNSDDLRTGRWTNDEMAYCDKLIEKFESGELPCADGTKLNDFLASMLKSKQSRLTKKMKNAKLSARSFKRTSGYVLDANDARVFSDLENAFYRSITCSMERAEIRFHLQKEWRELFSSFCVQMGQKLEADDWLCSVEEMDRRASKAKDAAKMARRKRMMGYALQHDSMNPVHGVFIEANKSLGDVAVTDSSESEELHAVMLQRQKRQRGMSGSIVVRKPIRSQAPPFLGRITQYMQRHSVPFEHVDAWVPSFVNSQGGQVGGDQRCRLCFAGCATVESQIGPDGRNMVPLSKEDQFDLNAFGEYSQRFSFDVGCGLPGRVYQSGVPSWEQHVQNAPVGHFERSGGALQWGIKTVLGIPIPSPNVGRVVVLFYSRHDRPQSQDLVTRAIEEMTKLMPSPKWKLVVDVGAPVEPAPANSTDAAEKQEGSSPGHNADSLLRLLTELMPTTTNSPLAPYLSGFTSLRMMLLKPIKTQQEGSLVSCVVQSYASYMSTGRPLSDIALLVVRDFMALSQTPQAQQSVVALAPAHAGVSQQNYQFQQQGTPQQAPQQAQQQPMQGQPVQQKHTQPMQQITIASGIDYGNGSGVVAVEPTPVSQLRGMNGVGAQQLQPQNQVAQFQQGARSTGANGQNQQPQYVMFNSMQR